MPLGLISKCMRRKAVDNNIHREFHHLSSRYICICICICICISACISSNCWHQYSQRIPPFVSPLYQPSTSWELHCCLQITTQQNTSKLKRLSFYTISNFLHLDLENYFELCPLEFMKSREFKRIWSKTWINKPILFFQGTPNRRNTHRCKVFMRCKAKSMELSCRVYGYIRVILIVRAPCWAKNCISTSGNMGALRHMR